jgi:hypothetical protein
MSRDRYDQAASAICGTQAAIRPPARGHGLDRFPAKGDSAFEHRQQADACLEERRLAAAVGAEHDE